MDKEKRKFINKGVLTTPLLLLTLTEPEDIQYVNTLLPFDTGFEIECDLKEVYSENCDDIKTIFKNIPFIKNVDINNYEQRFRIPHGIKGLICLYYISINLKIFHELNYGSGIHYHIDSTLDYDYLVGKLTNGSTREWLLKQLDAWKYEGTYNKRGITNYGGSWIRPQSGFKTFELRVGSMTFSYEQLVKRIIHGHQIIRRFRVKAKSPFDSNYPIEQVDLDKIKTYVNQNLTLKDLSSLKEKELLQTIENLSNKIKEENNILDVFGNSVKESNEMKKIIKERKILI